MVTTFPIVPASGSWVLGLLVVPLVLGVGLALVVLGAAIHGSQRASVEVSEAGLRLKGDLYGRLVPRAALVRDGVRVVNLQRDRTLAPVRRSRGTAIPGYRAGWFRLANGEKALLYLTDDTRVVYVPTTEGYSLLLSAADPSGLVERLRALGE